MFQIIPEFARVTKSKMLKEGLLNLEMCQISIRVLVRSKLLIEHQLKSIK